MILSNSEILQKFASGTYILSPLFLALGKIAKDVEGKIYNQNSTLKWLQHQHKGKKKLQTLTVNFYVLMKIDIELSLR